MLIVLLLVPAAFAEWTGWLSCTVGESVRYAVGEIGAGTSVSYFTGLPAGLQVITDSGRVYIVGTPETEGDYVAQIMLTDGQMMPCTVNVGSSSSTLLSEPRLTWYSDDFSCPQFSDGAFVAVNVESNGWTVYYQWSVDGRQIGGANSESCTVDTSLAGMHVYSCDISCYSGNNVRQLGPVSVTVSVNANTVEGIRIVQLPRKLSYNMGELLDTSGLIVAAKYTGGREEQLFSGGYEISPIFLNREGIQRIDVSYNGKIASFDVTVGDGAEVQSISVLEMPDKTMYRPGEKLNTTGLVLRVVTANGEKTVTDGYTCSPEVFETGGTQTVTVTYKDKKCSYKVRVEDNTIRSISVVTMPTKLEYAVGDKLDSTGLSVKVTRGSGTEVVDSGFTCTPKVMTAEGSQEITVIYEGKYSCKFNVNVKSRTVPTATPKTTPDPMPTSTPKPAPAVPSYIPTETKESGSVSTLVKLVLLAAILGLVGLGAYVYTMQKKSAEKSEPPQDFYSGDSVNTENFSEYKNDAGKKQ